FMVRYRASKQHDANAAPDHNTPLEVFWTVVPTAIVVVLFWQSYKTYMDLANPPLDAYEINVTGQKWNWLFEYPNGYIDADLHVPIGTPVVLTMTSPDVMHSFYVPEFRVKRDIIPGRYTKVWFEADGVGVYDIFCTEYCGTEHSSMMSRMVVHELADYHAWLEEASDFISRMPAPEAGEMLYNMRGCKQCHSVDGASGIGPTFQGLYGREEVFTDGTSLIADENYIQNSIYEPQAQIVAGYDPVMPTYRGRLKEEEVRVLIEYIKTLK
ncbi:MAG: cytochrome c oxidase subunit II, partial [Pseudomonadota bacterium]